MVFLGQIEGPVCFLLSLQSTRWFVFIARNLLLINPPLKNWKTYCPKYLNLPAFGTHPSPLPQEDTSTKAHRTSIYGGCHKWRDLQNGWFKTISLGKPWMGTLSASIYPAQDMTHSMTKYFSFQPGFRKVLWCAKCTTRSWPFFQACCRVQRKAQELLPQKWPFPKRGTPGFRQFLFFGDFICFHKDTDTDIIDYIHKYIHIYTLKIYMYCMYSNNLYI